MTFQRWMMALACTSLLGLGAVDMARADEPTNAATDQVTVNHSFRSSNLVGMTVRNTAGEDLGSISDLVLDVEKGNVRYAALSFGGLLGIGDKLFAVPWDQLKLMHDEDDEGYFVLDVEKEKLKVAPGFDKSNWPNTADPEWTRQIDEFYRQAREDRDQDDASDRVIP